MLKLDLFSRRNFAVGNLETFTMYAGIAILFFYLTIYLQEVAGYSALQSGLATLPVTIVMFVLSRRFGALADRYGPRLFMGAGPLIAAAGIVSSPGWGMNVAYLTDLLPALLVFAHRPLPHGRAAHRDDPRGCGRGRCGDRVGRQQRGRPRRRADRRLTCRHRRRGSLVGDTFAANSESVQAFPPRDGDLRRASGSRGRDRRHRDHESAAEGQGGAVPRRPVRRGSAARRRKPKRGRARSDVATRVPLTGTLPAR